MVAARFSSESASKQNGLFMTQTRVATRSDAPLITAHRKAMFEDMRRSTPAVLEEMSTNFEPWVASRLADGSYLGWIAEDDGTPIASAGMLLLGDLPPSPHNPSGSVRGHLLNVYVVPAFRRRGLARHLVELCLAEARHRQISVLTLHASDEGRPIYERIGFRATNEMQLILNQSL